MEIFFLFTFHFFGDKLDDKADEGYSFIIVGFDSGWHNFVGFGKK